MRFVFLVDSDNKGYWACARAGAEVLFARGQDEAEMEKNCFYTVQKFLRAQQRHVHDATIQVDYRRICSKVVVEPSEDGTDSGSDSD